MAQHTLVCIEDRPGALDAVLKAFRDCAVHVLDFWRETRVGWRPRWVFKVMDNGDDAGQS